MSQIYMSHITHPESVLLIATCGRLSWPALWTTFGRTIKIA